MLSAISSVKTIKLFSDVWNIGVYKLYIQGVLVICVLGLCIFRDTRLRKIIKKKNCSVYNAFMDIRSSWPS